jgi:hypothetical protein
VGGCSVRCRSCPGAALDGPFPERSGAERNIGGDEHSEQEATSSHGGSKRGFAGWRRPRAHPPRRSADGLPLVAGGLVPFRPAPVRECSAHHPSSRGAALNDGRPSGGPRSSPGAWTPCVCRPRGAQEQTRINNVVAGQTLRALRASVVAERQRPTENQGVTEIHGDARERSAVSSRLGATTRRAASAPAAAIRALLPPISPRPPATRWGRRAPR